jgi:xanthine dehydrogenase YagS FAD-binding subunit
MKPFAIADCTTVEAALKELSRGGTVKAGGVDLLDRMKNGTDTPERLVNIRNITELHGIRHSGIGVTLGALTTLAEIAVDVELQRRYTVLSDACGHAATPHLRNMATLGGNLLQELQCWYFRSRDFQCLRKGKEFCFAFGGMNQYHAIMDYETCPAVAPSSAAVALLALDATIELESAARGKRSVAIRDFYVVPQANPTRFHVLAADELLTAVHIPAPAVGTRSAYQKYGEKESHDWAMADAGVVLQMVGNVCHRAVVAMGAASPVVRRSSEAETVLIGKPITRDTARAAGLAAMTGANPLSMNGYKLQLFPIAIYRTILLAAGQMERDPFAAG